MSRNRLIAWHLGIGLTFSLLIGGLVWWSIQRPGWTWFLLSWLAGITTATFFYYGYDKWRAKNDRSRVPEAALHGLSILGGSLGAYVGMRWFRHKTIKGRFRILFWGIVALQTVILLLVIK